MDSNVVVNDSRLPLVNQEACVLLADKNGVMVSVNRQFSEISGYSWAEIIGKPCSMLLHPDSVEAVLDTILETVRSGEIWEGYLKKLTKSGESLWVYSTIAPMESDGGFLSSCRKILDEEISKIIQT